MVMRSPPSTKPGASTSTTAGMAKAKTTPAPIKATVTLPIIRPAKALAPAAPPSGRAAIVTRAQIKRHHRGVERAFGQHAADQIGELEGDEERVGPDTGAEHG